MKPAEKALEFYRGDSFEAFMRIREMTLVEGEYVPGAYIDITGWVGLGQLRSSEDDPTVLATFAVTLGNQTTTPGSAFLRLTAAEVAALSVASGKWDVQFTLPDSTVNTFLKGNFTVVKDVSKPV